MASKIRPALNEDAHADGEDYDAGRDGSEGRGDEGGAVQVEPS